MSSSPDQDRHHTSQRHRVSERDSSRATRPYRVDSWRPAPRADEHASRTFDRGRQIGRERDIRHDRDVRHERDTRHIHESHRDANVDPNIWHLKPREHPAEAAHAGSQETRDAWRPKPIQRPTRCSTAKPDEYKSPIALSWPPDGIYPSP